jgi:hypothetical protein
MEATTAEVPQSDFGQNQTALIPKQELENNLKSAAAEAFAAVGHFLDNIFDLFATIAQPFALAYKRYQRSMGKDIEPLLAAVERDIQDLPQRIGEKFKADHDEALTRLKDRFRAAELEQASNLVASSERPSGAPEKYRDFAIIPASVPEIPAGRAVTPPADPLSGKRPPRNSKAYELHRQIVSSTGWEYSNVTIPEESYLDYTIRVSVVVALTGLEYLIGFSIWEPESSPVLAMGLNLATVLGLTSLTGVAATYLKRYTAHRDAIKTFASHYPNGHPQRFSVEPFPSSAKIIAFGAFGTLIFFSLLLLATRLWLVTTGKSAFAGIAGSVALLFALLVYGFLEFSRAQPYSHEQYRDLELAFDREKQEWEQGPKIEPLSVSPPPSDAAIERAVVIGNQAAAIDGENRNSGVLSEDPFATYNREYDQILEESEGQYHQAVKRKAILIDLLIECQDTWDLTQAAYLKACLQVTLQVAKEFDKFGDKLGLGSSEADDRILRQLSRGVQLKYHDDNVLQKLQRHIFAVELPDLRIRDFTKVVQAVKGTLTVPWINGATMRRDGRVLEDSATSRRAASANREDEDDSRMTHAQTI